LPLVLSGSLPIPPTRVWSGKIFQNVIAPTLTYMQQQAGGGSPRPAISAKPVLCHPKYISNAPSQQMRYGKKVYTGKSEGGATLVNITCLHKIGPARYAEPAEGTMRREPPRSFPAWVRRKAPLLDDRYSNT